MSVLENNYNQACRKMAELVQQESEKSEIKNAPYIIVQVAYTKESFNLCSAAFTPSDKEQVPQELAEDTYYNMVFLANGIDKVTDTFKDKYLFRLAYADVSFALHTAYRYALMSEDGEYVYNTSFFKPNIKDFKWAYKDVIRFSDLGVFGCWVNRDRDFKEVDIQAEKDFVEQYEKLQPSALTSI